MAQRWEHSPPTNVARAQIPASTQYVGWVCCLFSPLLREVFLRVLRFSLSSKTNISKFRFDQESGRRRTTLWMCYLQIVIYLFFILFRRLSYDWNELPPWIVSLSVAWRDKNSCVGDLALDFCYYYYYYFAIMGNFIVRSPTVLQTSHQPCWNRVEMEDGWSRYNCYWRHGQSS